MARPHKQTVDYFPHDTDASDGKTLTIIQSKYGNDGYAFWFKLLQLLGKTPGHFYDFNKPADWEFLLAKTHHNDTEKAKDILETLVVLGAIDAELYAHGVIWCQKFVDRVADAYDRTVNGAPKRPGFLVNVGDKSISVPDNNVSANRNSKNATEIPQTKLKETKLKETSGPSHTEKINQVSDLSEDMAEITTLYEAEIGKITSFVAQELNDAMQNYPPKMIKEAIKGAVRQNKHQWSYVKGILKNWGKEGYPEGSPSKNAGVNRINKDDPNKYIKGKYGHMVRR